MTATVSLDGRFGLLRSEKNVEILTDFGLTGNQAKVIAEARKNGIS